MAADQLWICHLSIEEFIENFKGTLTQKIDIFMLDPFSRHTTQTLHVFRILDFAFFLVKFEICAIAGHL